MLLFKNPLARYLTVSVFGMMAAFVFSILALSRTDSVRAATIELQISTNGTKFCKMDVVAVSYMGPEPAHWNPGDQDCLLCAEPCEWQVKKKTFDGKYVIFEQRKSEPCVVCEVIHKAP